jgi:DMSO/TMAO reductase YedYZ molybdopterin-dependent catalytic subunit
MAETPESQPRPLPPGQQLAARDKWPTVGESVPPCLPDVWRVDVAGLVTTPRHFTLAELAAVSPRDEAIDIHCVTRWTKPAVRFTGTRLADLLERCGPRPEARFVRFVSYSSRSHDTSLPLADALSLGTMIVWAVDDRPLDVEHGGRVRVVVPGRYFYKSLKWLRTIELLEHDRLGFWEREAGYHNEADPWREQRYLAPTLTRLQVRAVLKAKDFAGRELRSMDCRGHELTGLNARKAILRDVDFRDCPLAGACFDGANLTNARFGGADLRGATFLGADLEGADFADADLRGADLTGASLFGATFRPQSFDRPTRFDGATKIDAAAIERLMPEEEAFVRALLAQARHA